jgi:murein DD-endopeptidase MepM/ murein hydrolase activator NlpD
MKKRNWTFLYVPEGEGGVRTVHVDRRLSYALAAAVGVFLVAVILVSSGFVRQGIVLHDEDRQQREIQALEAKIAQLEGMTQAYETHMERNFELLERAHLLAGLGDLDETVIQMGVGGPEPRVDELAESMTPLNRERITQVSEQLEKLIRQASFQEESYGQILRVLQDDQLARDATPSIRPIDRGYLSSRYGRRIDPFTGKPASHPGVDFSAPIGTPIYATASGEVIRVGRRGRMGKMVEIDHGNGIATRYAHMNGFKVEKGQHVQRGEIIGYVGNTGRSTGPHVHYEVLQNGKTQNPFLFIVRD